MFETPSGRWGESCFNVFDAGAQTALPCDDEDWYFAFCLTHCQEKWSHIPGEKFIYTKNNNNFPGHRAVQPSQKSTNPDSCTLDTWSTKPPLHLRRASCTGPFMDTLVTILFFPSKNPGQVKSRSGKEAVNIQLCPGSLWVATDPTTAISLPGLQMPNQHCHVGFGVGAQDKSSEMISK